MPGKVLSPDYVDPEVLGKSQLKTAYNYAKYLTTIATARHFTFLRLSEENFDDPDISEDEYSRRKDELDIATEFWKGIEDLGQSLCYDFRRILEPETEY